MRATKDELDPPFEILEPDEWRGPVVFNSPAQRQRLSARLPGRLAARSRDAAPLGGFLRRRADPRRACARGYPLMRAHFPRCYVDVNREPYELDPRMFDGRLPSFANTRSMRVAGGLGTVARVVGDAQEIYGQRIPVDDAHPPDREPLQALSPRAAAAVHARPPRFRRRRADRLPFHAVDRRRQGRAPARRRRAGRPLRHELRRRRWRKRSRRRCARWATWSAATSPMPAASSPSTTAIRPPACMPSSSRSTARSTWTSGATSASASFATLAADLETLADRLADIPVQELRPYRAAAE